MRALDRASSLRRPGALAAVVLGALAIGGCAEVRTVDATTAGCDRVADPGGSDGDPGTATRPLATAQALVDSLAPGETGCLREGVYEADDEIRLETRAITLRGVPAGAARLVGRVYVTDTADDATVADLELDGRNSRGLPSPTINADGVTLRGNDITNEHSGICVVVGSPDRRYGRARDTLIEDNTIHDCGRLPATNFDHGIYVSAADRTVIRDNLIRDNADRGVQLYPDAQHTLVVGNVITGNGQGVIFGGSRRIASSHNLVVDNVITDSNVRHNIESSWGGPVGEGNVVRDNCIGGGAFDDGNRGIQEPAVGFRVVDRRSSGTAPPCEPPSP